MGELKRERSDGAQKTPRRQRRPHVRPFTGPTLTPVGEERSRVRSDKSTQLTRTKLHEMKPAELIEALLAAGDCNKTLSAQVLSAQRLQENAMMETMAAKERLHKTYLKQKEAECDAILLRNETLDLREKYTALSDTLKSSAAANDEVERTKRERDEAMRQNDKMHAWIEAVNDDRRALLQQVHKLESEHQAMVAAPEKRTSPRNLAAKHEPVETKTCLPALRRPRVLPPKLDCRLSKSSSKVSLSDNGAENAKPKLLLPKIQHPKSPARVVPDKRINRLPLLPPISVNSALSGGDRWHPHQQQSYKARSSLLSF